VLVFAESAALFSAGRGWGASGTPAASALISHAIRIAQRSAVGDVHVFTRGPAATDISTRSAAGLHWHPQQGTTFGRRLENAVRSVQQMGYDRVVIIGTDVPALRASHLRQAATLLNTSTLAIGADHRGGCYAMALHLSHAQIIQDISWGQDTDFAQLLSRRPDAALLPQNLRDIDSTADLRHAIADTTHPLSHRLLAALSALLVVPPTASPRTLTYSIRSALHLTRRSWQLPPPIAA
jgi:glycosyltransferase A (GT-A) superfamily protein (DUF2064 family)